ncbi:MAG: ABC-F family ATP-binding cassette domain-containing protein [Armatimonadetes bacterium]|nr:ABC-F family ATP-binding cassette domain-containing protein [Armatimonadota bacterium]
MSDTPMALLSVHNIRKSFGAQEILRSVSFSVGEGDRAALVGPNGCGKSTLVRILVGKEEPDSGVVALLPNTEIGHLPQEVTELEGVDVLSAALAGSPRLAALEVELAEWETRMGGLSGAELEAATARYGAAQDEFLRLGGYEADARAKTILAGLGFAGEDLHKPVGVLSGGQKTRVYLARLLFQEPHLLVLDEPTNHLDLEAVEWLEEYLRGWNGTILVVSHDRAFLDRVADHIVDMSGGKAVSYKGNYSAYAKQKAANEEQQLEAYERQQEEIKKLQLYIDKYREGNRATMSKSRQNRLDRMERIERPDSPDQIKFKFKPAHASGREVLTLDGVSKRYGDLQLFKNLKLYVERGDRLGVVGPNGAGKSTFLRCLMEEESFDGGNVYLGHNVRIGTLSQQAEELDESNPVLEELMANSPLKVAEARDLLAQFLFRGEDVFKLVGALSGGERNRLLLSRLLASQPNLLLLDEPTNHLDLWCRQALENALAAYPGTVIFASHDRYLLQGVATRILEIKGGEAKVYNETWEEYRRRTRGTTAPTVAVKSPTAKVAPPKSSRAPHPEKRLKQVEREIGPLEERLKELAALLADPDTYADGDTAKSLSDEYESSNLRLQILYEEWEQLAEIVAA